MEPTKTGGPYPGGLILTPICQGEPRKHTRPLSMFFCNSSKNWIPSEGQKAAWRCRSFTPVSPPSSWDVLWTWPRTARSHIAVLSLRSKRAATILRPPSNHRTIEFRLTLKGGAVASCQKALHETVRAEMVQRRTAVLAFWSPTMPRIILQTKQRTHKEHYPCYSLLVWMSTVSLPALKSNIQPRLELGPQKKKMSFLPG